MAEGSIPSQTIQENTLSLDPSAADDIPAPKQDTMYTGIPQQIAEANKSAPNAVSNSPDWSAGG